MAVKDILEYYNTVKNQYDEMMLELKDWEKELQDGLLSPEDMEKFQNTVAPIKNNYETLKWIMFLLNKPVRKSKYAGYVNRNKKFLEQADKARSMEGVIGENNKQLEILKNIFK